MKKVETPSDSNVVAVTDKNALVSVDLEYGKSNSATAMALAITVTATTGEFSADVNSPRCWCSKSYCF